MGDFVEKGSYQIESNISTYITCHAIPTCDGSNIPWQAGPKHDNLRCKLGNMTSLPVSHWASSTENSLRKPSLA